MNKEYYIKKHQQKVKAKRKKSYSQLASHYTIKRLSPNSLNEPRPTAGIVVDASVIKKKPTDSVGVGQIQGTDIQSGEIIFTHTIPGDTTNNIAEFLAIHCGLEWCLERGIKLEVFTDSSVALAWSSKCKCGTKYHSNNTKQRLAILRAERRLGELKGKVKHWNTKSWGENPADFGRK